jgi:hypothetical protein
LGAPEDLGPSSLMAAPLLFDYHRTYRLPSNLTRPPPQLERHASPIKAHAQHIVADHKCASDNRCRPGQARVSRTRMESSSQIVHQR